MAGRIAGIGGLAIAIALVYGGYRVIETGATPGQFFSFLAALLGYSRSADAPLWLVVHGLTIRREERALTEVFGARFVIPRTIVLGAEPNGSDANHRKRSG